MPLILLGQIIKKQTLTGTVTNDPGRESKFILHLRTVRSGEAKKKTTTKTTFSRTTVGELTEK